MLEAILSHKFNTPVCDKTAFSLFRNRRMSWFNLGTMLSKKYIPLKILIPLDVAKNTHFLLLILKLIEWVIFYYLNSPFSPVFSLPFFSCPPQSQVCLTEYIKIKNAYNNLILNGPNTFIDISPKKT